MIGIINKILNMPFPHIDLAVKMLSNNKSAGFRKKATWNALPYSQYAYCLYHSCSQAKKLGIKEVAAIEFGVAGGRGLLALEKHAIEVEKIFGIKINVFGFDTGAGLVPPVDYKDMPYFFAQGNYSMDENLLRSKLTKAKLILGDVKETVKQFSKENHGAIAAVFFDLDYYSSTMDALELFRNAEDDMCLPRVFTYFDNTVGDETKLYNEFTGELLAIKDFNNQNEEWKVAATRHFLKYKVNINWHHQIYIAHKFTHRLYNEYISTHSPDSLSL